MMKAYTAALVLAAARLAAAVDRQAPDSQPPFCGKSEGHQVIDQKLEPGRLREGSARVYIYWKGMRWRWWRAQCKVALNGSWVAVLTPNTYSVVDVEAGKQRFCGAGTVLGHDLAPTWRSLLFLYVTPGETYYIECSPGGDDAGASEPTLSEPKQTDGRKAISKCRRVSFESKPER